jgi:putative endonuclease
MKHFVYILNSAKIDKYYIGYSQDPAKRLEFHNSELNKIWSKRGQPWELKVVIEFPDKTAALKAEKFIKRKKSIAYIQKGDCREKNSLEIKNRS